MAQMDIITTELYAPGKLFVLGEWAVLEGAPAVLIPAPGGQRGSVSYGPGDRGMEYHCSAFRGGGKIDVVGATEQVCRERFGELEGRLRLVVQPERLDHEGTKLGFGSSASAAALVAHAWAWACGCDDRDLIRDVAMRGHWDAQAGRGSGADVALSVAFTGRPTQGRAMVYHRVVPSSYEVSTQICDVPVFVTAVWSGKSADSRQLMDAVGRSSQASGVLKEISEVSHQGVAAWIAGESSGVMSCARQAGLLLEQLGTVSGVPIVTPEHEAIALCAGQEVVCKPSGAGGGDMALVIGDEEGPMADAEARLVAAGYLIFPRVPE